MWRTFALDLGLTATPFTPLVAQADNAGKLTAQEALENEQQVYGVHDDPPRDNCDTADESADAGAIVVCARKPVDSSRFRVKSTAELDPNSRQNLYDGLPRAPDLGPPPCVPSLISACIRFGGKPKAIHLIDLSKLPVAPPGSDADKIGKGDMAAP